MRISDWSSDVCSSDLLRLPDVFLNDQDLVLSSGLIQESTDGYDSDKVVFGGSFERRVNDILTVDYGVAVERSRIEDEPGTSKSTLVGPQVGPTMATSDDLLTQHRAGHSQDRYTPTPKIHG